MSKNLREEEQWGTVEECMPNAEFRVLLDDSKRVVRCYLAGKLKQNFIRILIADRVKVFVPPQGDICRITFRPREN